MLAGKDFELLKHLRLSPNRNQFIVVNVWTGIKHGGSDPTGQYTRLTGCDPTAMLTAEAQ